MKRKIVLLSLLLLTTPVLVLAQYYRAVVNMPFAAGGSSGSSVSGIESKSAAVLSPTGAVDVIIWRAPFACTVTKIQAYTVGGTSTNVNALKNASALLASDLVSTAGSWVSTTTIQNASVSINDSITLQIISVSGTPTATTIQIECTQ